MELRCRRFQQLRCRCFHQDRQHRRQRCHCRQTRRLDRQDQQLNCRQHRLDLKLQYRLLPLYYHLRHLRQQ